MRLEESMPMKQGYIPTSEADSKYLILLENCTRLTTIHYMDGHFGGKPLLATPYSFNFHLV